MGRTPSEGMYGPKFGAPRHHRTPRAAYWISRLISDIQLENDWKRINPDPKTFGIVATSIDELKSSNPTVSFFIEMNMKLMARSQIDRTYRAGGRTAGPGLPP
jgi:hypothetical protein